MTDAPARSARLEFQKLCEECQRLEYELRQSAIDPTSLERGWHKVWDEIAAATTMQARLTAVREHRDRLANQVRHMSETCWQVITSINH